MGEELAAIQRANEFAQDVDGHLKQVGVPPRPPAPYTVESARRWIEKSGQPWFDNEIRRASEFEKTLDDFSEGTYAHARATVTVAALWYYLASRRARVPKEAEKQYDVRVAYFGDWARHGETSLQEYSQRWLMRARELASVWGMFEIAVERPWLSQSVSHFLREPFPVVNTEEDAPLEVPDSVRRTLLFPEWPSSREDVLSLGQFGLTPRQLACARKYEGEPGVNLVLGRYFTTRALLFRDSEARTEAERLLAQETSPAAVVDRGLLLWLERSEKETLPDQARMRLLFDLLPPGDVSRRRLFLNFERGFGGASKVADRGPPESRLPPREQRRQPSTFDVGFASNEPRADFSWWTPLDPKAGGPKRVEGMRADLSDGSHIFIPYNDEGLDLCSMVLVEPNGQRSPHRPPDVVRKCQKRWAAEEKERANIPQ